MSYNFWIRHSLAWPSNSWAIKLRSAQRMIISITNWFANKLRNTRRIDRRNRKSGLCCCKNKGEKNENLNKYGKHKRKEWNHLRTHGMWDLKDKDREIASTWWINRAREPRYSGVSWWQLGGFTWCSCEIIRVFYYFYLLLYSSLLPYKICCPSTHSIYLSNNIQFETW